MPTPTNSSFPTRLLFLVNPVSGGGAGQRTANRIEALLQEEFQQSRSGFDIELTDPQNLLSQTVQACQNYSNIIAVGGDGTASPILQGILKEGGETRFGLIPLGTGNDLARSLGIYDPKIVWSKKSLRRVLQTVLSGRTHPMDMFEIEGAGFFSNYMGLGLDAQILAGYTGLQKTSWFPWIRSSRALKFLLYGLLLMKHLLYRLPQGVHLSIHSGASERQLAAEDQLRAVIVSNTRTYAGGFHLSQESKIDDGRFEVTQVRGIPDMLRILLARYAPFRHLTRGLLQKQTDCMKWTAPPGLSYEWDGELSAAPLPATGSIRCAGQVRILIP